MKNKVVVITGASSGIGAELVRQLGRMGAKIVMAARDEQRMYALSQTYPNTLVVPTDVTDPDACKRLIDRAVEHFGRIDVLVNNAGLSMWARFEDITDLKLFERIMRVNYLGSVYCTHYALPHLKTSKGLIVAISSVTGKTGVPTRTAYAASKHAVQGFFDSLRIELMDTGVDVSVISPGFIQTEMRERALGANGQPLETSHLNEQEVMPVEECVKTIVKAIQRRKRDVIIASTRIKLGPVLKVFLPGVVDRMAKKAIDEGKS